MSDYTQITDFSAKDALPSGNPSKLILGSDVDAELAAIATAISTKYDSTDIASNAQAAAGISDAVLMTPAKVIHLLQNATNAVIGGLSATSLSLDGANPQLVIDVDGGADENVIILRDASESLAQRFRLRWVDADGDMILQTLTGTQGAEVAVNLIQLDASASNVLIAGGLSVTGQALLGATSQVDGSRILTTADEGTGNGLDADTLDGVEGSGYALSSRVLTASTGLSGGGDLTANRSFALDLDSLAEIAPPNWNYDEDSIVIDDNGVAKRIRLKAAHPKLTLFTGAKTLADGEQNQVFVLNEATDRNVTIDSTFNSATQIGARVELMNLSTGRITVAGSGVTVSAVDSNLRLRAQYSTAVAVKVSATVWVVSGDLD